MTDPVKQEEADDTVTINDINQFAAMVAGWHEVKVNQLKHLLTVPEGTVFEVGDDKIELSGNTLKGFKFGVELCLMQLKDLPFVAEVDDAAETNVDVPNRH